MQIDLSQYRNPALQFSGGKDSLACLYLLRPQLDRLTVYWVNTGDTPPETLRVIEQVRPMIPRFVEIQTNVEEWRNEHGLPSDVVPASGHLLGEIYGICTLRISNRFDCCFYNLMLPMHNRMIEDQVDAVIRGTKRCDTGRVPVEGQTSYYDVLLPLRDWTHDDVFAYLHAVGAPENPIYEHFGAISAPECMGCTAWWDDRKAEYFKVRHPELAGGYISKLRQIKAAVRSHLVDLNRELED